MGEFRTFIMRGNVLDLAVAVIIGAAFGAIVTSLTADMIMPLVGAIFGKVDFSSHYLLLGPIPASFHGPASYAALKAAGVPMLGYGAFLTSLATFLILAFAIFLLVRVAARLASGSAAAEPAPVLPSEEVLLLREIRDGLNARA